MASEQSKKRKPSPYIQSFLDVEAEADSGASDDELDGSFVSGLFCQSGSENQTPPSPSSYRRYYFEEDSDEDPVRAHYRRLHWRKAASAEARADAIIAQFEASPPTGGESPTQLEDFDDRSVNGSCRQSSQEFDGESVGSVMTQASLATQVDDEVAQVIATSRAASVKAGVCSADERQRKSTYAITYFPTVNPGEIVRDAAGAWTLVEAARSRFVGFPGELSRLMNHPYSPIMSMGGQYECAPGTGTFHFQGWFQCYDKANQKQYKPDQANMASRLRRIFADDPTMFSVDGLRLRDVVQRFDVQPCATSPKQLREYCEAEFKEGKAKRAFPHKPLYYSIYGDSVNGQNAATGSAVDQVVALGLAGVPYIDMIAKTGKVGFMQTRNYQTLAAAVQAKKPKLASRCEKWWCRHPPVTENLGRVLAAKRGMEYNDFNDKINSGCDSGVMYSYGEGGTGKSTFTKLVSLYQNKGDVYFKLPGEFWGAVSGESYSGQKGVVFHEMGPHYFTGRYPLLEFKRIIDCTDCTVPTKNGNVSLRATKFYMDSNYDPVQLFAMMLPAKMTESEVELEYGAYSRRFKSIYFYSKPNSVHPGPTRVIGKSMPTWTSIRSFLMTSLQQQTRTGILASSTYSMPDQTSVEAGNTHRLLEEEALIYQTEQELMM